MVRGSKVGIVPLQAITSSSPSRGSAPRALTPPDAGRGAQGACGAKAGRGAVLGNARTSSGVRSQPLSRSDGGRTCPARRAAAHRRPGTTPESMHSGGNGATGSRNPGDLARTTPDTQVCPLRAGSGRLRARSTALSATQPPGGALTLGESRAGAPRESS